MEGLCNAVDRHPVRDDKSNCNDASSRPSPKGITDYRLLVASSMATRTAKANAVGSWILEDLPTVCSTVNLVFFLRRLAALCMSLVLSGGGGGGGGGVLSRRGVSYTPVACSRMVWY